MNIYTYATEKSKDGFTVCLVHAPDENKKSIERLSELLYTEEHLEHAPTPTSEETETLDVDLEMTRYTYNV